MGDRLLAAPEDAGGVAQLAIGGAVCHDGAARGQLPSGEGLEDVEDLPRGVAISEQQRAFR